MPSSCNDLKTLGYTLPGIYSVKGQTALTNNNSTYKIEFIFCTFSQLSSGRNPVKTALGIYFFKEQILNANK